jgi:hypothetical protein
LFHAERQLGSLLNAAFSRGLKVGYERKGLRHSGIMGLAGDLLTENKAAIGLGLLGVAHRRLRAFLTEYTKQRRL